MLKLLHLHLISTNNNRQAMNRRIYIVIVGLLALIGGANAQTLSVETIEGKVGEQATLTVSLTDAASATALQFNLSLPANVTVNESGCALGNAAMNHTLSVNKMDDSNYLFVMYSMDFTALTDGTLLTIPVTIGNGAATGNGNLNTVRSAKSDAVSQQHQNVSFAVNVTPSTIETKCATPTINISGGLLSFNCTTEGVTFHVSYNYSGANETLESNQLKLAGTTTCHVSVYATKEGLENSEVATADVELSVGKKGDTNQDGKVTITDAVSVVNIILNNGETAAPALETPEVVEPE